jgi:formyltetrahydrofolate-dependent phosphoribosylglycinamide formyltransferase
LGVKKIAVLISGNGSNLQALIDRAASGDLDVTIAVVVSSEATAFGLTRAQRAGIPTEVMNLKTVLAQGGDRAVFDVALADLVAGYEPDLVVLAGWMLVLSEAFIDRFPGRVINLHPALPGAFPGTHAIERAHDAFGRGEIDRTGVMVHRVVPEIDAGPVIAVEHVPMFPGESVEKLEERVHQVEHNLLVAAVDSVLRGDA